MRESDAPPALRDVLSGAAPAELARRPAPPRSGRPKRPDDVYGDLTAAGPLPPFGVTLGMMVPYAIFATGTAALVAAVCAKLLFGAYAGVVEGAEPFGLGAAMAVSGAHPLIGGVWLGWLVLGTGAAYLSERLTRSVWAVFPIVVALCSAPMLLPEQAWTAAAELSSFGYFDVAARELALSNLPLEWWVSGLLLGFGWLGARRDDGILMLAALVCALFLCWRLDAARTGLWSIAVEQVYDSVANAAPSEAARDGVRGGFARAAMAMHARALADLVLLTAPMIVTRTLTHRSLGAYGSAAWRELRQ